MKRIALAIAVLALLAAPPAMAAKPTRDADYVGTLGKRHFGNIWLSVSRDGRRVYDWHAAGIPYSCHDGGAQDPVEAWSLGTMQITRGRFQQHADESGDITRITGRFLHGGRVVGQVRTADGRAGCSGSARFSGRARHRSGIARTAYALLVDRYGNFDPTGVDEQPDGSLLMSVVDRRNTGSIRRMDTDGHVTTLLGFAGDFGRGRGAYLPEDIAALPGGGYVFSEPELNCVKRVSADGAISEAAGHCDSASSPGFAGDGGPATAARMSQPTALEALPDGGFLVADGGRGPGGEVSGQRRVRRVWPDGTITTVAGNGLEGSTGDGGPATAATFVNIADIAVEPSGGFLIADDHADRIRRVSADGIVSTVAGSGFPGFSGDRGPATSARMEPDAVQALPGGAFLVSDSWRLRRVTASGRIETVAGAGELPTGVPARETAGFSGLEVLRSGSILGSGKLIAARGERRLLGGFPVRPVTYRRAVVGRRAFPIVVNKRARAVVELRKGGHSVLKMTRALRKGRSMVRFPGRVKRIRPYSGAYILVRLTAGSQVAGARIDLD